MAQGTPAEIMTNSDSLTGEYLSGRKKIEVPQQRRPIGEKWVKLLGANGNNLKKVDLHIPVGVMTCVTGVSGSGKSTLINDTLFRIAHRELNGATVEKPAPYFDIHIDGFFIASCDFLPRNSKWFS